VVVKVQGLMVYVINIIINISREWQDSDSNFFTFLT
jgi:hypothetical protein